MSLRALQDQGHLRPHKTSTKEVADILRVVDRDLADARVAQVSADRRFVIAYSAALELATIALYAVGFRTAGTGHHWATFQALPHIMGSQVQTRADFLNACRSKRNITDYDRAGEISESEVQALLTETEAFRVDLIAWLKANHPSLVPQGAA